MKRLKKWLLAAISLILMADALTLPAFAFDSNVVYTGNSGEFIFTPGGQYSPTDLFLNFKDVMPGDTLTQKITVINHTDKNVKVRIYLRSKGAADEKYADFLNQMRLTVQKEEDTPMFAASADRKAGLSEWVCLGMLYSGGKVNLNVILEVPTSMDDRFQKNYGEIKWEFAVEELPVSPDDPHPPTGDRNMKWIWIILLALSASGIIISSGAFIHSRKKKRVEQ